MILPYVNQFTGHAANTDCGPAAEHSLSSTAHVLIASVTAVTEVCFWLDIIARTLAVLADNAIPRQRAVPKSIGAVCPEREFNNSPRRTRRGTKVRENKENPQVSVAESCPNEHVSLAAAEFQNTL